MIEKSLIVIIFLYSTGFALLGAQYVFADVFGITLTSLDGKNTPIKSNLLSIINVGNLNTSQQNVTSTSRAAVVNNPVQAAAGMAWELILLISGTYIFNILYLLGVPAIIVAGLVAVYFLLLMRSIMGYIRGI